LATREPGRASTRSASVRMHDELVVTIGGAPIPDHLLPESAGWRRAGPRRGRPGRPRPRSARAIGNRSRRRILLGTLSRHRLQPSSLAQRTTEDRTGVGSPRVGGRPEPASSRARASAASPEQSRRRETGGLTWAGASSAADRADGDPLPRGLRPCSASTAGDLVVGTRSRRDHVDAAAWRPVLSRGLPAPNRSSLRGSNGWAQRACPLACERTGAGHSGGSS
jgi:hypothetical protein